MDKDSKAQMDTDQGLDVISKAFLWDFDLFLQKVFLQLDPYSLRSCRQVCREWNDFIITRLWSSPSGRRRIRKRLRHNYLTEQPEEEVLEVGQGGVESQVSTCKADSRIVVCGFLNGTANVYDTKTRSLLTVLDCQSSGGTMRLDLSPNVILAASSYGVLSVWDREDFSLVFRDETLHRAEVTGVKVRETIIVTGDSDGQVVLTDLARLGQKSQTIVAEEKRPVTDLDYQQNILLLGSYSSLRVGSLSSEGKYKSSQLIKTDFVRDCKLSPPLALSSCGEYRQGVQVWDLRTGVLVRTIFPHLVFLSLEISDNLLFSVITSSDLTFPQVYIIDLEGAVRGKSLQTRQFACQQSTLLKPSLCIKDSKMFQAHGTQLTIMDFWYYQLSDWEIETFLDGIKL